VKPSAETQGDRCRACDFATLSSRFRIYSSPLTASINHRSRTETAQHLFSRLISLFITYGRLAIISIELTSMIGFIPPIYHTWSPRTSDTDLSISTGVGEPEQDQSDRSDRDSPHFCDTYHFYQGKVDQLTRTSITFSDRIIPGSRRDGGRSRLGLRIDRKVARQRQYFIESEIESSNSGAQRRDPL
jgi:hypothetical protein